MKTQADWNLTHREGTPETEDTYLCAFSDGDVEPFAWEGQDVNEWGSFVGGEFVRVVGWMELPKPPAVLDVEDHLTSERGDYLYHQRKEAI